MTSTADFYTSHASQARTAKGVAAANFNRAAARSREIKFTDTVYARLTLAGKVVAEFTRDRIADYPTLIMLLRAMTPTRRGLARLTVRNMSRGWRLEAPLMLYPEPGCTPESVCPMPYDF